MTKRVLVTGARGFVGAHCLGPLVARGYEAHAVSRRAPAPPTRGPTGAANAVSAVTWHQADLLDAAQTAALVRAVRPTHLLHLAWEVTPGAFWTSPLNWPWVDASLRLLAAFGESGGQRAVMVGSCAEYGAPDGPCLERSTPLAPTTLYGACKAALSVMLPAFAGAAGVESAAWARLFYLFGPGEPASRLVPSAVQSLEAGAELACTHGEQVRDVLYVADVADALAAVLDSGVTGAVNVGAGHGTSLRALLSAVEREYGDPRLLRFGARPAAPDDPPYLVADTTRLSQEVGWTPGVSLEDGIRQTIAWWRGEPRGHHPERPAHDPEAPGDRTVSRGRAAYGGRDGG
ncbi:MAG: NAD(P)-dependent oxidoreductase [Chloroflexota bacterium]